MGIEALNALARETYNVTGKCWPRTNVAEAVVEAQAELAARCPDAAAPPEPLFVIDAVVRGEAAVAREPVEVAAE